MPASTVDDDKYYSEKCAVCDKPASKACGACELEFYCSKSHQREHWQTHKPLCCKVDIKKGPDGDLMVSKIAISPGDIVATEYPLTTFNQLPGSGNGLAKILTICNASAYNCSVCGLSKIVPEKLHLCPLCNIPVCSKSCASSPQHANFECKFVQNCGLKKQVLSRTSSLRLLLTDIIMLRILLRENQKDASRAFGNSKWTRLFQRVRKSEKTDKEKYCKPNVDNFPLSFQFCKNKELVLLLHKTLSYAVILKKGLVKKACLYSKNRIVKHSCLPNAEMWVHQDDYFSNKLVIKATRPIKPGQCITVNLEPSLVAIPTLRRRDQLNTLGISNCDCQRCKDPSELATYISAIKCEENLTPRGCDGFYLPSNPLNPKSAWKCNQDGCKSSKSSTQISQMVTGLENELPSLLGKADDVLSKAKSYLECVFGDLLSSSHYIIMVVQCRNRQVVKHFLGCPEKMILCAVNNYPRVYHYCTVRLKAVDALLQFVNKISPPRNRIRVLLETEKEATQISIILHEYLVLSSIKNVGAVRKILGARQRLQESLKAITMFDDSLDQKEEILFLCSLCKKLLQEPTTGARFPVTMSSKFITEFDSRLQAAMQSWTAQSKSIGLLKWYLEPVASHSISKDTLRQTLLVNL